MRHFILLLLLSSCIGGVAEMQNNLNKKMPEIGLIYFPKSGNNFFTWYDDKTQRVVPNYLDDLFAISNAEKGMSTDLLAYRYYLGSGSPSWDYMTIYKVPTDIEFFQSGKIPDLSPNQKPYWPIN